MYISAKRFTSLTFNWADIVKSIKIALKLTYFDDVYFFQQCLSRTGLNHSFVTICVHVVVKGGLFWLHAPLPISTILQEKRYFTIIKKFVSSGVKIKLASELKGALDNFSLMPQFFSKKWDFNTIRSVYLCSDCMLNLTCKFKLITKICEYFLQRPL